MKKIINIISLLTITVSCYAGTVTAKFDTDTVRPSEVATYTLTFSDVSGRINLRNIPIPHGLNIVGQTSYSSNINGVESQSIGLNVIADTEGTFTVPEWKLELAGQTYNIPQATLKVDKNAPARKNTRSSMMSMRMGFPTMRSMSTATQQPTHSYEDTLKNNINLSLEISRKKIYVGETVPCKLIFTFDKKLIQSGFNLAQLLPQIKKADDFDCPAFKEKPEIDTTSNPDKAILSYPTVITPLKVGTFDLDFSAKGVFVRETTMEDLMNMSFFERAMSFGNNAQIPFETNMDALKIEVLPLPDGKPTSFNGAIGKFAFEQVSIDSDSLSVGDPCIITAKITGMGNFARIGNLTINTNSEWKTYKPKTDFIDNSNGMGYIGVKTYTITAVPLKADIPTAPQIVFSYFDPVEKKYIELKSEPISVSVAPTGRSNRITTKEAETPFSKISESTKNSSALVENKLLYSPYFWAIQVLILGGITVFVISRRKTAKLISDPSYAKFIRNQKEAKRLLAKARSNYFANDLNSFFANSKSALQHALTAKTDLEANALLWNEAKELMQDLKFSQEEISMAKTFFEGSDALIYGAGSLDSNKTDGLHTTLKTLITKIEKSK